MAFLMNALSRQFSCTHWASWIWNTYCLASLLSMTREVKERSWCDTRECNNLEGFLMWCSGKPCNASYIGTQRERAHKVKIREEPFLKKGDTFLDFDDWWQLIIDRVFYCANIWCTIIMIRAASIVAASLCTINSFVKYCPEIVKNTHLSGA